MENVSRDSLEWSLTHIERFGDTDFFPHSFEFKAIRHSWDRIRGELLGINLVEYRPKSPRRLVVPKLGSDFRVVTQLDPIDAILFTALVYEMSQKIEDSRIPEDKKVACSYRIRLDAKGALFAAKSGWPEFHEHSKALVESGKYSYVVVADITDFYNQASHHRIENALELAGISPIRAKVVEYFLHSLTAKQSRGLPVGPTASIILAEACLNDVDTYLLRQGVTHTRYVDDFRIFCENRAHAVHTLHNLCGYLYTSHRLALNSAKTHILSADEFLGRELLDPEEEEERGKLVRFQGLFDKAAESIGDYYGEPDLDKVAELIDDKDLNNAIRENIADLFQGALKTGRLHLGVARHLLRRATVLRTNAIHNLTISNLAALSPVLRDVANYLISTKLSTKKRVSDLLEFLRSSDYGGLAYCRIWGIEALTKIGGNIDPNAILALAESTPSGYGNCCAATVALSSRLVDWVRERKENWTNHAPWDRRAIIRAASVLPRDERNSWLGIVEETGDSLEKAVAQFVRSQP